ncbi:myelin protein zero-like protein 1 isoform X3 [Microcaecilia unicolor]|uniref:Myelin protein P0 n=1 Tax=Microcaecilia unicolor TaxID=1415580 RepID=A0A6P7YAD7_9AMPH|nr:myelin protein zero-like protein 1 isoform X3 [Microcaecilia unicolor]
MWRVGLVRLCAFSWALKLAFVFTVKAIEVYTPKELIVENGTQAKLPCTFKTSEVVSSSTAVTWIFKPEGGGRSFTFFYYTSGRHFMDVAPFKDRVSWAGDLNKKDASIYIKNMQFQDNGTYFCDLKNPPDIDATVTGEIQLKVVEKAQQVPCQQEVHKEEEGKDEADEEGSKPPTPDLPHFLRSHTAPPSYPFVYLLSSLHHQHHHIPSLPVSSLQAGIALGAAAGGGPPWNASEEGDI